jgi:hypothetical protein
MQHTEAKQGAHGGQICRTRLSFDGNSNQNLTVSPLDLIIVSLALLI